MAGYTRTDTTNNIADGNIINAADLDNEFDGIQAAFNSSTGHNHDGTTGEGAPILVLGPTQDVVVGATTVTPKTTNTVDIGSSSLKFKDLWLAGNASIGGTLAVTGVATLTAQPILSSLTASRAVFTDGSKGLVSNAITGTGDVVMSNSPTLVTPALGTPASGTLTNATGLPISTGVSGLGTGIATALAVNVGTAGAPVINGGALGTPSSGTVTNLTGTASININGTVGATTASTGAFTTLTTSSTVTLNGGTANGVAYLNGSKVLTTGSALTFDGTNLGIGTTSPSSYGALAVVKNATGLTVVGVSNSNAATNDGAKFSSFYGTTEVTSLGHYWDGSQFLGRLTSLGDLLFFRNGSEQMRLTGTGLGIGTSSSGVKLEVSSSADIFRLRTSTARGSGNGYMSFYDPTGRKGYFGYGGGDDSFMIANELSAPMLFLTSGTERARIDPNGALLVGTSTRYFTENLGVYNASSYTITSTRTGTGSEGHVIFQNANGAVGSIFTSGTSTSFNTSSDYRLKNTIAPMTGALAKVALLKPCTYKWNADGSAGEGFIAHELAEVVPQCVTGEKDAVDENGKPQYQGIDTSFLVATLTAAIQEQQAIIETLTARVAALESN